MPTKTGILSKCYHNRKRDTYAIALDDDSTWYGCYKTNYEHLEGQKVKFQAEKKGQYWNVVGDVEAVDEGKPAAGAGASGHTGHSTPKDRSIVMQTAFKVAGRLLPGELEAGTLPLGTAKKGGEQHRIVMEYLKETALEIYQCCIDADAFIEEYGTDNPGPPAGDDGYDPADA